MKMQKKAHRYLELAATGDTDSKEFYSLGRQLAAKGLDPKHSGLMERALILDNKSIVQAYIDATAHGKCPSVLKLKMSSVGITKPNRRHLQAVLNEIARNAKAVDRLKHTTKTRAPHREAALDELDELTVSEDDVDTEF